VSSARITSIEPRRAIEGGRLTLHGEHFDAGGAPSAAVLIGGVPARVVFASPGRVVVQVPGGLTETGPSKVDVAGASADGHAVDIAMPFATGLHQVDSPVFDRGGNLYVTYSGTRGQQVPVSIFRVRVNGTRETFSSGIVNPTSMAIGPDGQLYVSSRFEGTVYRLTDNGVAEPFATDLGVACGLAFAPDGTLFVGDRTGTIFKVDNAGRAVALAMLPSSVAAFHLALGRDGTLFVSGPTLSTYDAVYRVTPNGETSVVSQAFGRPQGLAVGPDGSLFVVEALAGSSGLYRLSPDGTTELVLSGPGLVGVAFDRHGGVVVCSNDTAYRLWLPI
jgi:hypothetical protein